MSVEIPGAAAAWLAAFGGPRGRADSYAPSTLKQALDGALSLGSAAGRLPQAMRLVGDIELRLAALASELRLDRRSGLVGGVPAPRTAIVKSITGDDLLLAGRWVPGLAAAAGLRTVGVDEGEADVRVGAADLAGLGPGAIIFALSDASLHEAAYRVRTLQGSQAWRATQGLPRAIYLLDGTRFVNVPGPTIARSVELLAHAVHAPRAGVTPAPDEAIEWNVGPTE